MTLAAAPLQIKRESDLTPIVYPESDGMPMADNSKQFRVITSTEGNLEILCENDPNIFVAGDMFWYPVEGHPEIRQAPDVMVVFGRPKGDRGSYMQWLEENIAPQVVFEILSPGNRKQEMDAKFAFYEKYGVEEYYLYDPDRGRLRGWLRDQAGTLQPITHMIGWRSPRLGIRFDLDGLKMQLYFPDGRPFLTYPELEERRRQTEARVLEALEYVLEARELATVAEERAQAAEQKAQIEAQARADAEQKAQAEAQARADAEQKAQAEAQARADAEQKAQAEAQARANAEEIIRQLQEKLRAAGLE